MLNILRIKELQIKTILRFYFAPARKAKIQKTNDKQCWRQCGERELSFTVGKDANGVAIVKTSMEIPQKARNRSSLCLTHMTPMSRLYHSFLCIYLKDSIVYNRSTCSPIFLAAFITRALTSISWWVDDENVVRIDSGVLFNSKEKKWNHELFE